MTTRLRIVDQNAPGSVPLYEGETALPIPPEGAFVIINGISRRVCSASFVLGGDEERVDLHVS